MLIKYISIIIILLLNNIVYGQSKIKTNKSTYEICNLNSFNNIYLKYLSKNIEADSPPDFEGRFGLYYFEYYKNNEFDFARYNYIESKKQHAYTITPYYLLTFVEIDTINKTKNFLLEFNMSDSLNKKHCSFMVHEMMKKKTEDIINLFLVRRGFSNQTIMAFVANCFSNFIKKRAPTTISYNDHFKSRVSNAKLKIILEKNGFRSIPIKITKTISNKDSNDVDSQKINTGHIIDLAKLEIMISGETVNLKQSYESVFRAFNLNFKCFITKNDNIFEYPDLFMWLNNMYSDKTIGNGAIWFHILDDYSTGYLFIKWTEYNNPGSNIFGLESIFYKNE